MNMDISEFTETEQRVIAALEAAVEEKGRDYVYPPAAANRACTYLEYKNTDDDPDAVASYQSEDVIGPSCIAGHALLNGGARTVGQLVDFEGVTADLASRGVVGPRVSSALDAAQNRQDSASTWGEALDRFYEVLARDA
jgi:hypothetical protein